MTTPDISTRKYAAAGLGACMLLTGPALADQVINDDLIVTNSICVGNDCSNGESFGFDTLRLKENNLRIAFIDTSTSASFPTRDWQIVANDSSNGGASYLAFHDVGTGGNPFLVEADTPSHSLYVDSSGRIGLGTSSPLVDIHLKSGNTPTLRLEQDGSSGFTSQVFDVAANEANFFIRDATNGSALIFRIRPGAPVSSIDIAADGDIGLGTASPSEALHLRRTNGSSTFLIEEASATAAFRNLLKLQNNGDVGIRLENTSDESKWALAMAAGRFTINGNGGEGEFTLDVAGNLTLLGTLTTTGSCATPCDAVFEPDYEILPIAERAELMYDLGYLPNVGPTVEAGQYDLTKKVLGMLNELEHAHIYISELNERIDTLEEQLLTRD
jgi:hypothetical protein